MDTKKDQQICPVYRKCGGCSYQGVSYPEQLSIKQKELEKLLGKYAHVNAIMGMKDPLHYRTKVHSAIGPGRYEIISGQYAVSTHRIVPVESCMIEDEEASSIIKTITRIMPDFGIRPFDDAAMKGFLRHVLIRKGRYTGQVMVVLVTYTVDFRNKDAFIAELVKRHPSVVTVVQNINSSFTSMVLGDEERILYGNGYIEDELCGCTFRISADSFYQVNPVMAGKLYLQAMKYLSLKKTDTLIDAYCGTGTIGIMGALRAGKVIGIESNARAVEDAWINASLNHLENIEFVKADATKYMAEMASLGIRADAVVMDPPRSGSTVRFMKSVVSMAPSRIVYVSCGPDTLARDLGYFVKNGYEVKKIQPFDMFPFTSHVETVVLLG